MSGRRCIIIITTPSVSAVRRLELAFPIVNAANLLAALDAARNGVMLGSALKAIAGGYLDEEFTDSVAIAQDRIVTQIPQVIANITNGSVDIEAGQLLVDSIADDMWNAAANIADAFDDLD